MGVAIVVERPRPLAASQNCDIRLNREAILPRSGHSELAYEMAITGPF